MNKKHIFLLFFCVLFFAYQAGLRSSVPNVLNEDLQTCFGIGTSKVGLLASLFFLVYTSMQIPVGILIDMISLKKIAVLSFAAYSLGLIGFVSCSDFNCVAIVQMFLGLSASFSFILIMKVTNDYFPKEKIALVSGIAASTGNLGPVICTPMLAYLSSCFPWKNVLFTLGIIGFICAIIGGIVIKEKDLVAPNVSEKEEPLNIPTVISGVKEILSDYRFIMISIFSMTVLGALSSFCDAWGVSFLTHTYCISKEEASFAISFTYAGTIAGGPIVAYLADRLNNFKKVMLGGTVCFGCILSVVSFVNLSVSVLYIILFVMGICATSQFLVFPVSLSITKKSLGATVTGIVNSITMLGCTVLIWLFGYVLDWSKGTNTIYSAADYKCSMQVSILSIVIGIIFLSFTKLPKLKKNIEQI